MAEVRKLGAGDLQVGEGTVTSPGGKQVVEFNASHVPVAYGTANDAVTGYSNVVFSVDSALSARVDVRAYGAAGNGTTDDTAAIQAAINAAAAGQTVYFPAGTYIVNPTSTMSWAGAGTIRYVAALKTGLRLAGTGTIKLKDNVSSNSAVVNLVIFGTNQSISDVQIVGLTFDLNGANNPINNTAGVLHAAIMATGDNAGIDNLVVRDCTFQNSAGGTVIGLGQSNTAASALANNAKITGNTFLNNGLDSPDHSSIYAWAEDVLIGGNFFYNSSMPTQTRLAFEQHGARQKFINNIVYNFTQGGWVSDNYTSVAYDLTVAYNTFYTSQLGVGLWYSADESGIRDVSIYGNFFSFDNTDTSSIFDYKAAIYAPSTKGFTGLDVSNNVIIGTSVTTVPVAGLLSYCGTASENIDRVRFHDNRIYDGTVGVWIRTTNTPGGIRNLDIYNNLFVNFKDVSAYIAIGVGTDGKTSLPIGSLRIRGNSFIDNQISPTFKYGIRLAGAHSYIDVSDNYYQGLTLGNYTETLASDLSPFAVSTRYKTLFEQGLTIGTSGVPLIEYATSANTVADNGTIVHMMSQTPNVAIVTGSIRGESVAVTAIDSTNITVGITKDDGTAGTQQTVYWIAIKRP